MGPSRYADVSTSQIDNFERKKTYRSSPESVTIEHKEHLTSTGGIDHGKKINTMHTITHTIFWANPTTHSSASLLPVFPSLIC